MLSKDLALGLGLIRENMTMSCKFIQEQAYIPVQVLVIRCYLIKRDQRIHDSDLCSISYRFFLAFLLLKNLCTSSPHDESNRQVNLQEPVDEIISILLDRLNHLIKHWRLLLEVQSRKLGDVSQGSHGKLLPVLVGFWWSTTWGGKFMLKLFHLGIFFHALIKSDLIIPNVRGRLQLTK